MTLLCKPVGRGNWHTLQLSVTGSRAQPMLVKVGDRFPLAGIVYRVCRVCA